jgi:hypothetical protein
LDIVKIHFTQNRHVNEAITAIKQARSAPVQKPVAWMYEGEYSSGSYSGNYFEWRVTMNKNATNAARKVKPLYTTPPAAQRQWVGLTDEELREFDVDPVEAKLMIAKLKEKNT